MISEYGLGRLPAQDGRDQNYLLRAALPEPTVLRRTRYWGSGWWGDQGPHPYCVGFSWAHFVEDGPITHRGRAPAVNPLDIYMKAQLIDEWPGESYEGTSVRAGAKVLQELGVITEYRWAFDVDTMVDAILTKGPVVLGTDWFRGMFEPDAEGIIKPSGGLVGGHAYIANGATRIRGLIRIKNSWGRTWGKAGYAYISMEDMKILLDRDGECCMALEAK